MFLALPGLSHSCFLYLCAWGAAKALPLEFLSGQNSEDTLEDSLGLNKLAVFFCISHYFFLVSAGCLGEGLGGGERVIKHARLLVGGSYVITAIAMLYLP